VLTTRILIVTRNRLYREGLANAFNAEPSLAVVGSLEEPSTADVLCLSPDIVLIDAESPRQVAFIAALARSSPHVRVVVLGISGDPDEVIGLVKAGIHGYVTASSSLAEMVATVEQVARGEMPCSSRVAARMATLIRMEPSRPQPDHVLARLTARELEVVALLNEGLSNKEIALRLEIDHRTVKNHARNIYGKLAVHSRGEAAAVMRRSVAN
jgi:two-component system, NarL family, nitrate/nitrite response regulator NarL